MHPVTAFASIEADKENILPISQGRSALKLQEITGQDPRVLKQHLNQQRLEFENSLKPEILQDLDDPLDSYIQYIKWIRENYTTGNTNESLLVQVLERTTHDFKDDEYYKNEIRYFKIWLEYITYSDHPGDVFNYLLKKKIGSDLSIFYENYSLFYELNDQWENAKQILLLGISKNARPYKRLLNSYENFKIRKNEKESKICDTVPLSAGLSNTNGLGLNINVVNNKKKKKLEIFNHSNPIKSFTDDSSVARLDSIQNSKKENILKPSSWEGEVLKVAASKPKNVSKLEVLNDKLLQYPITKTIKHANGKYNETYDFNFELFMPKSNEVMSMMEVLLSFQNPSDRSVINTDKNENNKRANSKSSLYDTPVAKKVKLNNENDEQMADSPGIQDTPLLEYFKHSKGLFSMNEDDENFNANVNTNNNNIPGNNLNISNETQKSNEKYNVYSKPEDTNDTENNLLNAIIGGQFSDVFTDHTASKISEAKTPPKTKSKIKLSNDLSSSPFVENPDNAGDSDMVIGNSTIQNPYDVNYRRTINKKNSVDLFKNLIFHNLSNNLNKLSILQTIFKPKAFPIYGNKQALLELGGDQLYCITKEIGRGKNSITYLSEKMDAQLFAIKISSPPDIWESSILFKLNQISNEFIKIQAAYKFNDELCLILPFFKQGSIFDMVNCLSNYQSMTTKNLIDETLVIYLTIQILANMLKLHSLGIIHGNLNSNKFMLNFQYLNSNKLTFKDLAMIDFGDSIDLSLYSKDTKFQFNFSNANMKDGPVCKEFINNLPWSYEPDYFGIANIIHTLLFNKSIKVQETLNGIQIIESMKKYWQTEIWNELFNILLNPKLFNISGNVTTEIERVKGKLESWFNLTVDKRLFLGKLRTITEILETRFKKVKN